MASRKKPAGRRSVPAIARRGRVDPLSKSPWGQVSERIKTKINNAARNAAVATINGLAEKGPAYSGQFRDSWQAIILGGYGIGNPSQGSYPYKLSDVPKIKTSVKAMQRVSVIEIANTAPYALYAMDILPGKWRKPSEEPIGGIEFGVLYGVRQNGPTFRWDVQPDPAGENVSTAERDWYENYIRGGAMSTDVKRVVKLAFRKGDNGINIR